MGYAKRDKIPFLAIMVQSTYIDVEYASVAEWSIAFDCKSNAFGLRRFESSPAHITKESRS